MREAEAPTAEKGWVMPWRQHLHEIAAGVCELSQAPVEALVSAGLASITTTHKAMAALVAVLLVGIALGVGGKAVLDAPAEIAELQDRVAAAQAHTRQVERDLDRLVLRMDQLICELQTERTGDRPADCPPTAILR